MTGRTLFVSDIHLRPSGAPGAREHAERFFEFVREAASHRGAKRVDTMYVLGDLFDYWFEPGRRIPGAFAARCASIRQLVDAGLRVIVLPGNRDFLMGRGFTEATGAELAPEELTIELGGQTMRLLHGDSLMPASHRYRMWCRASRGHTFRRIAVGLPECVTQALANLIRSISKKEKRKAGQTSSCFSRGELESRFSSGADTIVAGHYHECLDNVVDAPSTSGRLVVLGSWDDCRGAHAVWDGSKLTVVR